MSRPGRLLVADDVTRNPLERTMADQCSHLDKIRISSVNQPGCRECLAVGGTWVHLRLCVECGQVGCCDNSPARHATRHFEATGHPIIRNYEPDEDWWFCYLDDLTFELTDAGPARAGG